MNGIATLFVLPHTVVAGSAVTGFVPSPAERVTAERVHVGDVSVTVKVTASGAVPVVGVAVRVAAVVALNPGVVLPVAPEQSPSI